MVKLAKIREYVVTGVVVGALAVGGMYTLVTNNQNKIF